MPAGHLPVTSRCPTCRRLHVDWVTDADTIGKAKGWNPNIICDECYVAKALPMYREMIRKQAANRKSQMFERNKDADLRYLDSVHLQLFKRKLSGTDDGKSSDSPLTHNQETTNTEQRNP